RRMCHAHACHSSRTKKAMPTHSGAEAWPTRYHPVYVLCSRTHLMPATGNGRWRRSGNGEPTVRGYSRGFGFVVRSSRNPCLRTANPEPRTQFTAPLGRECPALGGVRGVPVSTHRSLVS